MSIFIVVMVGGGTFVSVYWKDIQIRWYIHKLDSEDKGERKKAFDWLYKKAKKDMEDSRLEAFFKHPESLKQVEVDKWGEPISLVSAVENGEIVELKILLVHGEDVNIKTIGSMWVGSTPLHTAANNGNDKTARILIEYGAEVNAKNKLGRTPLDYAAMSGKDEIARTLIKHGANVNSKSNEDHTSLDYALSNNHKAVATLLRANGGKTRLELFVEAKAKPQKDNK